MIDDKDLWNRLATVQGYLQTEVMISSHPPVRMVCSLVCRGARGMLYES